MSHWSLSCEDLCPRVTLALPPCHPLLMSHCPHLLKSWAFRSFGLAPTHTWASPISNPQAPTSALIWIPSSPVKCPLTSFLKGHLCTPWLARRTGSSSSTWSNGGPDSWMHSSVWLWMFSCAFWVHSVPDSWMYSSDWLWMFSCAFWVHSHKWGFPLTLWSGRTTNHAEEHCLSALHLH